MNAIDLTGTVHGRWTVLSREPNTSQGQARWLCRCICGKTKVLKSILIRRGISRSCGCLHDEVVAARSTKHGHSPMHGRTSPTYYSWAGLIQRCTNPKSECWADYGGRGIKVCERWRDFRNFLADMGEKPRGRYSIDRIDNSRGYEPDNCQWATDQEQARNSRHNRMLTFRGQAKCVAEWSDMTGIPAQVIYTRLFQGWDTRKVLTTPVRNWGPGKPKKRSQ